jgi:hypothetical protein
MICISKCKINNLTVGKKYEVVGKSSCVRQGSNIPYSCVWVINDAGIKRHYSSKRFVDVAKWRDIQLNNILDISV